MVIVLCSIKSTASISKKGVFLFKRLKRVILNDIFLFTKPKDNTFAITY